MKYKANQQGKTLFLQYQKEISLAEHAYLLEAIQKLTSSLSILFEEQGEYLRKLNGMLKLSVENTEWTNEGFMERIVERMRKGAESDIDPSIRNLSLKLAENLAIIRNLFDGDISFYNKTFPSFKKEFNQEQIERIRLTMQTITHNHISALIVCIEKELQQSQGVFHVALVSKLPDSNPQIGTAVVEPKSVIV